MRNPDCYRIAKSILPHLPLFVTNKKSEIFISPIGNVIRGFLFESTAYAREEFYYWWFLMPVCRPMNYIGLSNGDRLCVPGGLSVWRTDMENLTEKLLAAMQPFALPLLTSINTNQDAIATLYRLSDVSNRDLGIETDVKHIHVQHDIACLHVLDRQFQEAEKMLNSILAHEHGSDSPRWLLDMVQRAKVLHGKLLENPEAAISQVKEWQDFTFKALKLERWR